MSIRLPILALASNRPRRPACCRRGRWPRLASAALTARGYSISTTALVLAFFALEVHGGPTGDAEKIRMRADFAEQQKDVDGAIAAYEEMISQDPSTRAVIGTRLMDLYIAARRPDRAMAWAKELMAQSPDPQAFLANVYTRLHMYAEARAILEKELAAGPDLDRAFALWMQLSALHESAGAAAASLVAAERALEVARDTPHEPAARRRLEACNRDRPPL